jgi:hypothetical protein
MGGKNCHPESRVSLDRERLRKTSRRQKLMQIVFTQG